MYLRDQSAEFVGLADVEAVVDGIRIPMHSHVLAKNSKVFAQFFSSLVENDDGSKRGTPTKPTSVTPWFDGESLEAVLMLLEFFYNPYNMPFEELIIAYYQPLAGETMVERSVFHEPFSAVRLADKLDCRTFLGKVDILELRGSADYLGWFIVARELRLHKLTCTSLSKIVSISSVRPVYVTNERGEQTPDVSWRHHVHECASLVNDKRWLDLDPVSLMLVTEAKTMYNLKGLHYSGNDTSICLAKLCINEDAVCGYSKPGEIVLSQFHENGTEIAVSNARAANEAVQPLDGLAEQLEEQALEDFNDEWDEGEQ